MAKGSGIADFQQALTGHFLVGRALVESIFDAMELFFAALDDATGPRRKRLTLFVAGTIEILYVCRCVQLQPHHCSHIYILHLLNSVDAFAIKLEGKRKVSVCDPEATC